MTQLAGGVVALSGAASGIGRALALRLAQEGAHLALADVRDDELATSADAARACGVTVTTHHVDVSQRGDVERWAAETIAAHGRVRVLINNAGVATHGAFDEQTIEDFEWLFGINFWGVLYGLKAFLPHLRREPFAHIANTSSIFGIVAPAGQAAYSASKFAVRGLSEVLRHELEGTAIRVSVIHPGGIDTNIAERARYHDDVPEAARRMYSEKFKSVARTSAAAAADTIVRGIRANRKRILVGPDAVGLDLLQRLRPAGYWTGIRVVWDPLKFDADVARKTGRVRRTS
ncbi:MAG: SDR family oxidoreductase [Gemmatimonadetes bacterium]|nr:SDR family oxidoreductase [Gemmatimonadota bacterium]